MKHNTGSDNTPRIAGTGDDMIEISDIKARRRLSASTFLAVAAMVLIASHAGAVERVVLGEYFTNVF